MVIRPLAVGEQEIFVRSAGRTEHAAAVRDYLQRLLTKGNTHPEWCFLLEEANQVIGTIAYWTFPSLSTPTDLVLMELPWEREDYLIPGTQMVHQAVLHMQLLGTRGQIRHVIDLPPASPQWQYYPEQRAALLARCGFVMQRETLRWNCQVDAAVRDTSTRLIFRSLEEVGKAAFLEALERGSAGTLDRLIRQEREQMGPARHAQELFTLLQHLGHAPGWWQLAYTRSAELVGFVLPCTNMTVGYVGVIPEQRGNGFIDDLLSRLTETFAAAGATTILADTDVSSTPMANALRRAGWSQFGRRQEYVLELMEEVAPNESI